MAPPPSTAGASASTPATGDVPLKEEKDNDKASLAPADMLAKRERAAKATCKALM